MRAPDRPVSRALDLVIHHRESARPGSAWEQWLTRLKRALEQAAHHAR